MDVTKCAIITIWIEVTTENSHRGRPLCCYRRSRDGSDVLPSVRARLHRWVYRQLPATDSGVVMSTTVVLGLGILAWVLLAVLLALSVGRMIRLRDRQRPDRTEQGAPVEGKADDSTESLHTPPGWQLRNKT